LYYFFEINLNFADGTHCHEYSSITLPEQVVENLFTLFPAVYHPNSHQVAKIQIKSKYFLSYQYYNVHQTSNPFR